MRCGCLLSRCCRPAGDDGIDAYTQGLMDFGATLCTRGRPDCARCPFADHCIANATGRQRALPAARRARRCRFAHTLMLVMRRGAQVWLQRRAPTGIWGGLWSLPEGEDTATLVRLADRIGIHDSAVELQPLTPISHTFTHFRLEIEPLLLLICRRRGNALCGRSRGRMGCHLPNSMRSACRPRSGSCCLGLTGTLL